MSKRLLALLLALLLLPAFSACEAEKREEVPTVGVYYVTTADYEAGEAFVSPFQVPLGSGDDRIHTALRSLEETPPQSGLASAFIRGTRIDSYTLEGAEITVDVSPAYIGLTELEKTALKACLTLTLCGLDEIEGVNVCVDGEPVAVGLEPSLLMVENTDSSEIEKRLLLCFPDPESRYLIPEYRMLTVGRDRLLAEYVVEELLEPEPGEKGHSPFPAGTRLLSVEQRAGVCTVNLSREFIDGRGATAAEQRMCVYAIVDSLTRLDGVERVRFRVEGNDTAGYEYIDLSAAFTGFQDLVLDPEAVYSTGATLYLGLRGSETVVPVSVRVPLDTSVSFEESLVAYLLAHPSVSGYTRLVPVGVTIRSIETVNRVCTLDLSEALFSSGFGSNARRAAMALASSLLDTNRVDAVNILVEGEPFLQNVRERIGPLAD